MLKETIGILKCNTRYIVIDGNSCFNTNDDIGIFHDTVKPEDETYTLVNFSTNEPTVYKYITEDEALAKIDGITVEEFKIKEPEIAEPTYEIIKD